MLFQKTRHGHYEVMCTLSSHRKEFLHYIFFLAGCRITVNKEVT